MDPDPKERPICPPDRGAAENGLETPPSESESRSTVDPMEHTATFEGGQSGVELDAVRPTTSAESADIPTTLGRFQINGILGKGEFGTVYLGFDNRLKRQLSTVDQARTVTGR